MFYICFKIKLNYLTIYLKKNHDDLVAFNWYDHNRTSYGHIVMYFSPEMVNTKELLYSGVYTKYMLVLLLKLVTLNSSISPATMCIDIETLN